MKMQEIQQELHNYFIYKDKTERKLAVRENDNIRFIEEPIKMNVGSEKVTMNPIAYLKWQINNNLIDGITFIQNLSDVLPMIDFQIFNDYDNRNAEIDKHKELLKQIQGSKSLFGRKKDFKLIYVQNHNHLLADDNQINYYVIKGTDVIPVESALIEDTSAAIEVKYLDDVKKALNDDFNNIHEDSYKEAVSLWESLI